MKRTITAMFAAAITAFSVGCVTPQIAASPQSLRGADVATQDQAPDEKAYQGKKPGTQKPIPRTFSTQPPLISHAVENFDEVTLEENQCLTCHGPDVYVKKNAPKIGDSHVDKGTKTSSTARHACVMCHVPQADAKPLVDNFFKGDAPATAAVK